MAVDFSQIEINRFDFLHQKIVKVLHLYIKVYIDVIEIVNVTWDRFIRILPNFLCDPTLVFEFVIIAFTMFLPLSSES